MVVVLIRRCVRPDKEPEFIKQYRRQKPDHPDFIDEKLTKLSSEQLSEPMCSLRMGCERCVTYLNIACWRSAESFQQHFNPSRRYDLEFECSERLRAVFQVIDF